MSEPNWQNRTLFHGDNLDFLRAMNSESVDLIATDPPFNKGRDFHATPDSLASGAKFQDRWSWEKDVHREWVDQIKDDHKPLMEAIESAKHAHSDGMGAFMCFMAVRLLAMRRVLKPTGSLYLHCDPTASHYLKAVMDAVFGWQNFRNEVIWMRTSAKTLMSKRLPSNHDAIFCYQGGSESTWNSDAIFVPYDPQNLDEKTASKYRHREPDGRLYRLDNLINPNRDRPNLTYEFLGVTRVWRWTRERMQTAYNAGLVVQRKPGGVPQLKRYLDEQKGRPFGDVWTDIPPINSQAQERTGYPTQKPLTLYERIIKASSNEGDMVLDPFCGCATTLVAAERLKRQWVGIDIWDEAHETVIKRLQKEGLEGPDGSLGEALPPLRQNPLLQGTARTHRQRRDGGTVPPRQGKGEGTRRTEVVATGNVRPPRETAGNEMPRLRPNVRRSQILGTGPQRPEGGRRDQPRHEQDTSLFAVQPGEEQHLHPERAA